MTVFQLGPEILIPKLKEQVICWHRFSVFKVHPFSFFNLLRRLQMSFFTVPTLTKSTLRIEWIYKRSLACQLSSTRSNNFRFKVRIHFGTIFGKEKFPIGAQPWVIKVGSEILLLGWLMNNPFARTLITIHSLLAESSFQERQKPLGKKTVADSTWAEARGCQLTVFLMSVSLLWGGLSSISHLMSL
jgi:hypothetical protein